MRPSKKHMKVERYVEPAEFAQWKTVAEEMGFLYVAAGPLVRSSYKVSPSHAQHRHGVSSLACRLALRCRLVG